MKFHFSKENLKGSQARLQRALEILPGLCSWGVLLGLVFLSVCFPFAAAVLIVAFYLQWIMRVLYSTLFLLLSYVQLDLEKNTNWMSRIHGIDLSTGKNPPPASKDIYHLVIFPVVKEGRDILEPAIDAISRQSFPLRQIVVFFALEERALPEVKNTVFELEKKYKTYFLDV